MNFDQEIEQQEEQPEIEVVRGSEVPEENKKNPFYNPYHWGMADWEDKKLYLPDSSDEAISFSIAAHELGHLVKKGRIQPDRFDFKPTHREELRAWDKGWVYLEKYLPEYYGGDSEIINRFKKVKDEIEKILMEITVLTEPFYSKTEESVQKQREGFLKTEAGQKIKESIDNLKNNVKLKVNELGEGELLNKIDWERYRAVINKALMDIEKDNESSIEN